MNLLLLGLTVVATVAISVAVMYAVRRSSGPDRFLTDTTRGSAIFGVVGTGFAVSLAFVMFFSYQGFNDGKTAAEAEAGAVTDMSRTAKFFPTHQKDLTGVLFCYGRSVIHLEWPAMATDSTSQVTEDWRLEIEDVLREIEPRTAQQGVAYGQLLTERDDRSSNRRQRIAEAHPAVGTPVWVILILGGLVTLSFVILFTDRDESAIVQLSLMGTVAVLVSAALLLVAFLDHPYENESGSVKPTEMAHTLAGMHEEYPALVPPCTPTGLPRRAT